MQAVALVVIPGGVAFAIWRAYRGHRRGLENGGGFAPSGKIRWEAGDSGSREDG